MRPYANQSARYKAAASSGNAWTYTKHIKDGMDVADIQASAAPSSFGQVVRRGGEYRSYFRNLELRRRIRRSLNKANRRRNRVAHVSED
jgi:hypothetical protein